MIKRLFKSFQAVNTFNSALIVDLDELLQVIFPLNGLGVVDYILYQNSSTPFDLCKLILGNTSERVEIDLRNVLSRVDSGVGLIVNILKVNDSHSHLPP
jgi:hypothetical protein